ncbi:MAG: YihY/virulence factor BrkB family protein [Lachnospiraceae bacterium]|nr:YihY/virulence factor BrkB family protein [Lachnospiraceae bacterium]
MIHKLYIIMRDFAAQMKRQNISAFAASTAFFIFVSLVPMLVMICTIIPFTPLTEEILVNAVTEATPDIIDALAESLISEVYNKSAGILSISAIATLWTAGKGILALIQGFNSINGVDEKRNYVVLRVISALYTLIMLAIVVIILLVMVFGNQLAHIAIARFPQIRRLTSMIMDLRTLFTAAILTFFFSIIYTYIPNKKLRFKEQVPGAFFAATGWCAFSWGFSLYVTYSNSYSIYGSLSIIVIVMLWLYFCMYIMMVGAYINRYFRPVNRVLVNRHHNR